MKKVLFTTLSIIAVAAMMLVSCKKDDNKGNGKDDNKEQVPEGPKNLWTAAEEANAILVFQYWANYAWAPYAGYDNVEAAEFPNLAYADGVYTITYAEASPARWQSQFFMHPDPTKAPVALEAGKNYEVSVTLESNQEINPFAKFTAYGPEGPKHEGAAFKEWGNANDCKGFALGAEPVVLKTVIAGSDVENVHWTFDFGTHPANTVIKISKITIIETEAEIGSDPEPAPFAVVVNGDLGDWGGVAELTTAATSRIRAWKATSDEKNVYFYFALRKNRIDGKKLTIGFNTDKDATTGSLTDDNSMKGCEAIVKHIIPFTNATDFLKGTGSGNGVATDGTATENAAICWGLDMGEDAASDASNIYLEVRIPKAVLALPAGEIEVGASYDYYFTNYTALTL